MIKSKVVLMVLLTIVQLLYGQNKNTTDYLIIDTIKIENPVVLVFNNIGKYSKKNMLLYSWKQLDDISKTRKRKYNELVFNSGFKILPTCLIDRVLIRDLYQNPSIDIAYASLAHDMQKYCEIGSRLDSLSIWNTPVKYENDVDLIYLGTDYFLIFLINIEKLNLWEGMDYYKIKNMSNCYLRVAVPAPWIKATDFKIN